ncbi:MAG: SOS response-associated peptidase [Asgard group archaeon]|nr:SOS response-associated peptidase [Asgard group archaeon]
MCGRFARFSPAHVFRMLFQLDSVPDLNQRYNIAPGQKIYAVRGIPLRENKEQAKNNDSYQREMVPLQWGLIPFWADKADIGYKMINARSETVDSKASFKVPFQQRRCLIPTDGFYEWEKQKTGSKQPYFVRMKNKEPFAFAGLWEKWKNPEKEQEIIESCTILTIDSNDLIEPIHRRMPVIMPQKNYASWLNPNKQDPRELKPLIQVYDSQKMEVYPVSRYVNNPQNTGKKCIKPENKGYKQQTLE